MGQIDGSIKALIEKLQTAESALTNLQMDLARIETDLAIKTRSLALDHECMDKRQNLTNPDFLAEASANATKEDSLRGSAAQERASQEDHIANYDPRYDPITVSEPTKISGVMKRSEITNGLHAQNVADHNAADSSMPTDKNLLETTYKSSYETGRVNLRSGDLARTLGKSMQESRSLEANKQREVLFN